MDPITAELIKYVLTTLLGTGGIVGVMAGMKAYRTRRATPKSEGRAVARAGADWEALNKYWERELREQRTAANRERRENDAREAKDAARIAQLEQHIWLGLPPPPPPVQPAPPRKDDK